MKKLKMVLSLLLTALLIVGCLVGCSKKPEPSSQNSDGAATTSASATDAAASGSDKTNGGQTVNNNNNNNNQTQKADSAKITKQQRTTIKTLPESTQQNLTVSPLTMSSLKGKTVRQRATSSQTRMLVNHDNPLFIFHTITLSPKSEGESMKVLYNALPADIRAFSALYTDTDTNSRDKNALYASFEKILSQTDAANIPTFIQIENWNSVETREGFTQSELSNLLKKHKSLMGFVHVELSCSQLRQEELDRMKTTLRACKENNALFVWQEMEYSHCTNTVNRALEDKELYQLMKDYAHNVIIQDKHNGQGRHFSTQAAAMGAWLSGVCGNWGSNVESWLWWEEGMGDYNDMGTKYRGYSDLFTLKYPPALAGIDTICDMIGGANVYSSEELHLYEPLDGNIAFSEAFWSIVYPLYQRIVRGAVPQKSEVVSNIKVAYQFTSADDRVMQGIESKLFMDIYGGLTSWYNTYRQYGTSKKWVPTTGRYYIVPTLCKYVNASAILPNADILTNSNYTQKLGSTAATKQNYFNSKYAQTYTGNGTMFKIGNLTYILNDLENQTKNSTKSVAYTMKSGVKAQISMREHTYAVVEESQSGFKMDLTNLRLDTSRVCNKKENKGSFMDSYLEGGKMDSASDFRETVIVLTGVSKAPKVAASGSNHATATLNFSAAEKTAIITVKSNGAVKLTVTN